MNSWILVLTLVFDSGDLGSIRVFEEQAPFSRTTCEKWVASFDRYNFPVDRIKYPGLQGYKYHCVPFVEGKRP